MDGSRGIRAVFIVVSAFSPWAHFPAHAGALAVRTADGLGLALSHTGEVSAVELGGAAIPALADQGGFEAIDMQQADPVELLADPGFEGAGGFWALSGGASGDATARSGEGCLRFSPSAGGTGKGQSSPVAVVPGVFYRLSAWIRMQGASKPPAIRLVQTDAEGEEVVAGSIHANEFPATDGQGTHDWAYMVKAFFADWRARAAQVELSYDGEGMVWIDDVSLSEINRYEQRWTPFPGRVYEGEHGLALRATADRLGLRLQANYRGLPDRIEVSGEIEDTTGEDRAIQLRFRLPVDLTGWWWYDDLRHQRRIGRRAPCQHYIENVSGYTVGLFAQKRRPASTGKCRLWSLFPFGAIGREDTGGIALAQPMDEPRVFRIQYLPGEGLEIAYDFGLSKAATKFPGRAPFRFVLYRFNPAHGFRAALDRYYRLFPQCFERRAEKDGLYGYFRAWLDLPHPEDFGMAYELGGHPDGKKYGSYTFIHPLGSECDIRGKEGAWKTGEQPALSEVVEVLRGALDDPAAAEESWWQDRFGGRYSSWGGAPFIDSVQRALNSGIFDEQGSYCIHYYSDNLPQIISNTDPEIESPNMNEGEWQYYIEPWFEKYDVDGVDFDNIGEGPVKGYADNYRREHSPAADIPLVFNYTSLRPTILNGFSQYEFVRQVRDEMLRRGKLTTGNVTCLPFLFHAALMDKLGGEEGEVFWGYYGTPFHPYGGYMAFRDYSRILAYHKPVATLCSQGFRIHRPEEPGEMERAEQILVSSALTGTFANLHSGNMEPFRELYKRYVPAVRPLSAAGWEPITHAEVVGQPQTLRGPPEGYGDYPLSALIERFGAAQDGSLRFVLYDCSRGMDSCQVRIDLEALGVDPAKLPSFVETLAGGTLEPSRPQTAGGRVELTCPLTDRGLAIIAVR